MRIETLADEIVLYHADCREVLPMLPKVDACVTDPPYGIGDKMQGGTWGAAEKYSDFRRWDIAPSTEDIAMLRSILRPPFGSIIHQGKKKGPTAWVRKAIIEQQKGKRVVLVYPVDKWVLMILSAIGTKVRNLGDVRWLSTEDGLQGKETGRHIACFILEPVKVI